MKKIVLLILFLASSTHSISQGKVRIFNTDLKVKDIIGTPKLTTQKWNKEIPQVLVKNEDYYLETLGSYRDNYNEKDPNSFLNLIDRGSYPILDEFNMKYYHDIVIPNLKLKEGIKERVDFINFCKEWEATNNYIVKKSLLFKDGYGEIGKIIQRERFKFTTASFTLSKEVYKKLSATITADIKAELQAQNISANSTLVNHLSRLVNNETSYQGIMIVAEFDDTYMTKLKNTLNNLKSEQIGTDDFSLALIDFASPGSVRAATTGFVVFKLKGEIKKFSLNENDLKADLQANFKSLSPTTIDRVAATISVGYVSKVTKRFSSEIDNIYIKNLLTSRKVDDIEISKLRTITN